MRDPANRKVWLDLLGPVPASDAERSRFELQPSPPGGWRNFWSPIWSFDNPSIHGEKSAQAILQHMNWTAADIFPLPAWSSDIHKVIEHTHSRLVDVFFTWYYNDRKLHSVRRHKAELEETFHNHPVEASADVIWGGHQGFDHHTQNYLRKGRG
jgi:hypothetical protein